MNHPFSFNNSLGFAGGKHYQKITILIFRLVLQNFAILIFFPISTCIFFPYFFDKSTQRVPSLFLCFLFDIFFFVKLIMACRLCDIYAREYNDSNVYAMITRLVWTIWTPMSAVPKKAVELNHSLPREWLSIRMNNGRMRGEISTQYSEKLFCYVIRSIRGVSGRSDDQ